MLLAVGRDAAIAGDAFRGYPLKAGQAIISST
jgi:hypothetical protein